MELGLVLILIGMVAAIVLVKSWVQSRVDVNPRGPVDSTDPKVRIMQRVIPRIVHAIDSSLENTTMSYLTGEPSEVMTLIMDIEQFKYLRKKRGIWEHQGLFAEREIERKWARRPSAVRQWEGIQYVVPIAIRVTFDSSATIRTVRFWIGDVEADQLTVCRVSVEAKRSSATYDWRYNQRAKGYLAPVTPHGDENSIPPTTGSFAEDPYDFEQQVAQMLKDSGLTVEVTGGPGDEGVDIIAYDSTPLTGGTYLVQCKRYNLDHKVGVAEVRELYGTVQEKRVSKGILVTSSVFTYQALRFAEDKPLELIDGVQLSTLIEGYDYSSIVSDDPVEPGQALAEDFQMSLHEAVQEEQILVIAGLLEIGVDIDTRDEYGYTPLHRAAFQGNKAVAALLLENGAFIEATNQAGSTPLLVALSKEQQEQIDLGVVTLLLEHGADANATVGSLTPLTIAVSVEGRELTGLLIDYGADVNLAAEDGMVPLRMAVGKENISLINVLLEHGADANTSNEDGFTPLDLAVGKHNLAITSALIDHGAEIEVLFRPLHMSVHYGGIEIVELLLNHGANVDMLDSDGLTPLQYAMRAETWNPSVIRLLLERGADVEARYETGATPLHVAAAAITPKDVEVIGLLINHGANVNAQMEEKWTPLHVAVQRKNSHSAVASLLRYGAKPDAADIAGYTPLHWAAEQANGDMGILLALLAAGADIDAESNDGQTPLHRAVGYGNLKEAALLLDRGAKVDARDNTDGTPLHIAAARDDAGEEIIDLLLRHGADANAQYGGNHATPMHLAAQRKDVSTGITSLLIEHGADTEARGVEGHTPLHSAAGHGSIEVISSLLESGADIEASDSTNWKPLHHAAESNHAAVALLLKHGANPSEITDEGYSAYQLAKTNGASEEMLRLLR